MNELWEASNVEDWFYVKGFFSFHFIDQLIDLLMLWKDS